MIEIPDVFDYQSVPARCKIPDIDFELTGRPGDDVR
jgi:hypothetical protein